MGAGSVVNVSFGGVEGQRLAQPGEFTHLHRDTCPLIDHIDTGGGVALDDPEAVAELLRENDRFSTGRVTGGRY
jgi:hypothetical protein